MAQELKRFAAEMFNSLLEKHGDRGKIAIGLFFVALIAAMLVTCYLVWQCQQNGAPKDEEQRTLHDEETGAQNEGEPQPVEQLDAEPLPDIELAKKESAYVPDIHELEADKRGANSSFDTANDPKEREHNSPSPDRKISVGFMKEKEGEGEPDGNPKSPEMKPD